MAQYKNNSSHKDIIRERWVDFIRSSEIEDPDENGYVIITFPSEEMHDLMLFSEEGLITLEPTETGSLRITRGTVICFEKDTSKWRYLNTKLSGVNVYKEFGNFLSSNYRGLLNGKIKIFPVDAINLDYEKMLSKNEVPIDIIIRYIFEFQTRFEKNFSLFITWPKPFEMDDDDPSFIDSLKQVIDNNLTDPNAISFRESFFESYESVDGLEYEHLSIIGLTKKILRESSNNRYQVSRNEFYTYGEDGRQPMISVLYFFAFVGQTKAQHTIYSEDVSKALIEINEL